MAEESLIDISVTAPYEALGVEIIRAWSQARANMDPEIRKGWDAIGLKLVEPLVDRLVAKLKA
jgi:hypothetical protein